MEPVDGFWSVAGRILGVAGTTVLITKSAFGTHSETNAFADDFNVPGSASDPHSDTSHNPVTNSATSVFSFAANGAASGAASASASNGTIWDKATVNANHVTPPNGVADAFALARAATTWSVTPDAPLLYQINLGSQVADVNNPTSPLINSQPATLQVRAGDTESLDIMIGLTTDDNLDVPPTFTQTLFAASITLTPLSLSVSGDLSAADFTVTSDGTTTTATLDPMTIEVPFDASGTFATQTLLDAMSEGAAGQGTVVPEPSSLQILIASGLLLIGLRGTCRR
jgi:hypothetical protein